MDDHVLALISEAVKLYSSTSNKGVKIVTQEKELNNMNFTSGRRHYARFLWKKLRRTGRVQESVTSSRCPSLFPRKEHISSIYPDRDPKGFIR
jgi:hypothetical protein